MRRFQLFTITSFLTATALACAQPALEATPAQPQVDLAWKVLPRRVTADNFGARVAKLYFAVVAVVGNNSGHDLEVVSLHFQLPAKTGISSPVPSDPYRIVRGTLEREHLIGLRNTTVNVIKALGPLLAGGSGFVAGAAFPKAIDLFSNPFEKGIEQVFPDRTLNQMVALDNQTMRDTALIPDNTQQLLLVFISRDLLVTATNRNQISSRFKAEFEPQYVMRELGELVLTGRRIEYIDRVKIKVASRY